MRLLPWALALVAVAYVVAATESSAAALLGIALWGVAYFQAKRIRLEGKKKAGVVAVLLAAIPAIVLLLAPPRYAEPGGLAGAWIQAFGWLLAIGLGFEFAREECEREGRRC